MRKFLGWSYVDCLFETYGEVSNSIDYVMFWWTKSANLLNNGAIRRFGLVTTNSIKQFFNRRVIEDHIRKNDKFQIIYAIPDHPWIDSESAANVRVAVTVCSIGEEIGKLDRVVDEQPIEQGEYRVFLHSSVGQVSESLTVGTNPNNASKLLGNRALCGQGVKVVGDGFYVPRNEYSLPQWQPSECIKNIISVSSIKKGDISGRMNYRLFWIDSRRSYASECSCVPEGVDTCQTNS